jgi:hypothetical protein
MRLALGAVVLVAERIRPGSPPAASIAVGLGLLEQSAAQVRAFSRRGWAVSARVVSWSIGAVGGPLAAQAVTRSRQRLAQVAAAARRRGEASLATARAEASAFAQTSARDGIDGLLPRVIDRAVPLLIDDALPEIRGRVVPLIIDDLTHDNRVRRLVLREGERAVTGAAQYLRNATAGADDRVEAAARHLGRRHPRNH